jgi:hypothetical protein
LRNFNQWTSAVNFDFCPFNKTYESITINEDFELNHLRDPFDVEFTKLLQMWEYIRSIQQMGKWKFQSNILKTIQNFFKQFNLDAFRALMNRQWFDAIKEVMPYFFAVKRLTMKMQLDTNDREIILELERFKCIALDIINAENKTEKSLERFKKLRNFNYEECAKEIRKKL